MSKIEKPPFPKLQRQSPPDDSNGQRDQSPTSAIRRDNASVVIDERDISLLIDIEAVRQSGSDQRQDGTREDRLPRDASPFRGAQTLIGAGIDLSGGDRHAKESGPIGLGESRFTPLPAADDTPRLSSLDELNEGLADYRGSENPHVPVRTQISQMIPIDWAGLADLVLLEESSGEYDESNAFSFKRIALFAKWLFGGVVDSTLVDQCIDSAKTSRDSGAVLSLVEILLMMDQSDAVYQLDSVLESGIGPKIIQSTVFQQVAAYHRHVRQDYNRADALLLAAESLLPKQFTVGFARLDLAVEHAEDADVLSLLNRCATSVENIEGKSSLYYLSAQIAERSACDTQRVRKCYELSRDASIHAVPAIVSLLRLANREKKWQAVAEGLLDLVDHIESKGFRASLYWGASLLYQDRLGDLESSLRCVKRAITLKPRKKRYRVAAAELLRRMGSSECLSEYLESAALSDSESERAVLLGQLAWLQETSFPLEKSSNIGRTSVLERAVAANPRFPLLRRQLLSEYHRNQSWHKALDVLLQAREFPRPDSEKFVFALRAARLLRYHLDRPTEAIAAYQRALEIDNTSWVGFWEMTSLLQDTQKWEDLASLLSKRIALGGDANTLNYYRLRLSRLYYHHLDDPDRSLSTLNDMTAEGDRLSQIESLNLLLETQRYSDCVGLLSRESDSTADSKEEIDRLLQLADIHARFLNDSLSAKKIYRKVLTLSSDNKLAVAALVDLLAEDKDWHALVDLFQTELEKSKDTGERAELSAYIGYIYAMYLNDVDKGVQRVQAAYEIDRSNPLYYDLFRTLSSQQEESPRQKIFCDTVLKGGHDMIDATDRYRFGTRCEVTLDDDRIATKLYEDQMQSTPDDLDALLSLILIADRNNVDYVYQRLESIAALAAKGAVTPASATVDDDYAEVLEFCQLWADAGQRFSLKHKSDISKHLSRDAWYALTPEKYRDRLRYSHWYLYERHEFYAPRDHRALNDAGLKRAAMIDQTLERFSDSEFIVSQYLGFAHELESKIVDPLDRNLQVYIDLFLEKVQRAKQYSATEGRHADYLTLMTELRANLKKKIYGDALSSAKELSSRNDDRKFSSFMLGITTLLACMHGDRDEIIESLKNTRSGSASSADRATRFLIEALGLEIEKINGEPDNIADALRHFARITKQEPYRIALRMEAAQIYAGIAEREQEALDILEELFVDDPAHLEATALAEVLLIRLRHDLLLSRLYSRYIAATADTNEQIATLLKHAELASTGLKDLERSLIDYREVLRLDPLNRIALSGQSFMLEKLKRWSEAIEAYQAVIEADVSDEVTRQAQIAQGRIWLRELHEPNRSRTILESISTRDDDSFEVISLVVETAKRTQEWDRAKSLLAKVAPSERPDLKIWAQLQMADVAYQQRHDKEERLRHEKLAIAACAAHPDHADILCQYFRDRGEIEQLVDIISEQIGEGGSATSTNSLRLLVADLILSELDQPSRALGFLREFLVAQPNDYRARQLFAVALEKQGDLEAALASYRTVIEFMVDDPGSFDGISRIAAMERRYHIERSGIAVSAFLTRRQDTELSATFESHDATLSRDAIPGYYFIGDRNIEASIRPLSEFFVLVAPYVNAYFAQEGHVTAQPNEDQATMLMELRSALGVSAVNFHRCTGAPARVALGATPAVALSDEIWAGSTPDTFIFWAAFGCALVSSGGAIPLALSNTELNSVVDAIFESRSVTEEDRLLRKELLRMIPRRVRRQLEQTDKPLVNAAILDHFRLVERMAAFEIAFTIANNPAVAFNALIKVESAYSDPLDSPVVRHMLRFSVSEHYDRIYQSLWTG